MPGGSKLQVLPYESLGYTIVYDMLPQGAKQLSNDETYDDKHCYYGVGWDSDRWCHNILSYNKGMYTYIGRKEYPCLWST